jgi:hypothetical protein
MVERRLWEVVIVGGRGGWLQWMVVVEMGCLLIFSYPSKTHDTHVTGAGFTGVQKCQPAPVPVPTCDLNLYGFVNP